MQLQNNKLDFSSQQFYIGLDVHKKTWTVTIRSMGVELKTFSMQSNPKGVYEYMKKNYPNGEYFSVYESGFCGYWLHRQLKGFGFKNIVVNPAAVPTSGKEKLIKLDPIDSRKLARELENKSIESIYIPDELQQEIRSLSRLRYQQIKKQTRLKNQIKGYLNFYGHKLPENCQMQHWSGKFIEYLRSLQFNYEIGREQLDIYLEELINCRERLVRTIKALRKYCIDHGFYNDILLMCSAPGIGFITAVTLYTELMDIKRFPSSEKLACYVGLIPMHRGSGEKLSVLGMRVQYNRYLRCILIESAWIALRKDPALTLAFNQYLKRMSKQEAVVRIAKKLLCRISYVLKNKKQYVYSVIA